MPLYQKLPEVLQKYKGYMITDDLIKKILKESERIGYIDVDDFYRE
jgi:hypothetical protein